MLKPILLIAHRGYSGDAPENTFAAFDLAIELGFADMEFDVQMSRDGVPVIIHDETLERTTDGTGNVADKTYAELAGLDAGSWFDTSFAGQRIPSLEDFLKRYKGRAHLHLEIKSLEPELPAKIGELLAKTGWAASIAGPFAALPMWRPRLVISSYDRDQLVRSKQALPKQVIHELLVEQVSDESMQWAADNGMRSYHPDGKDITPELVRKAKKLKLHVGAWWWSAEEQDITELSKSGMRYAYVNSPGVHVAANRPHFPVWDK